MDGMRFLRWRRRPTLNNDSDTHPNSAPHAGYRPDISDCKRWPSSRYPQNTSASQAMPPHSIAAVRPSQCVSPVN